MLCRSLPGEQKAFRQQHRNVTKYVPDITAKILKNMKTGAKVKGQMSKKCNHTQQLNGMLYRGTNHARCLQL